MNLNTKITCAVAVVFMSLSMANAQVDSLAEGEKIYKIVNEAARFPGCEHIENLDERKSCSHVELLKFIYREVRYTDEARREEIEGGDTPMFRTVYLGF